jgi:uncharacterized protein (TIGR04255 family)
MTDKFEAILYKNNFLQEVIARIDLVSPISILINELPKEISTEALSNFPIDEPKKGFTQQVVFSPSKLITNKQEFTEWNFYGRDRKKMLRISPDSFFISYNKYETFDKLRAEFDSFKNCFFNLFKEAQPSRLGLRYINQIDLTNGNPFDWHDFLDSNLLNLLNYKVDGAKPSRIFHNYEVVFPDEYNLRFNFGLHNPDYPSPLRKRIFTLDYDAYYKGLMEPKNITDFLDSYHSSIQELFEHNITDKLRKVMNETK